ncbi:hypothetical protein GGI08_002201, partial [Coemansia sp. S2]
MTKVKLSAYEQERLANIKQNRELLLSLNLVGDSAIPLVESGGQRRIVNKSKTRAKRSADDDEADDGGAW